MGMSVQEKQKVIESNAASVSESTSGFLALLVFSSLNSHDSTGHWKLQVQTVQVEMQEMQEMSTKGNETHNG